MSEPPQDDPPASDPEGAGVLPPSLIAFSAGARVAGAVIMVGYLSGLVAGPVIAVVGGLALITFGRGLLLGRVEGASAGLALAVMAAALGVGALRWGTVGLADIRGVQAALGPTLLVGPERVAGAAILAGSSALVATAVWVGAMQWRDKGQLGWWLVEVVLAGFSIATVFWGPALTGGSETGLEFLEAAGAMLAATLAIVGLSLGLSRLQPRWRVLAVATTGAGVAAGAALIGSVL